ncbi:hypothetical protein G7B22_21940 [Blautia sp. MSK.20.9]|uniref:hypothetical protein n=1 Tax=Blautia sp. MSK20_18 TaxID=2883186 RepID=UPI00156F76D3|nr:hypothetical protein [Blautia sp. MSK20_18]MCB7507868.1 hypothetical protein [Blautia sp. MSK20_18]NSK11090.1 hypothetical protein [Blautia sp. MSK.20.9]
MMPENKDELLKKQNEEIQKLKKELKQASKPSSMFSVLKNTVKRNVHDFFIREDRMKNMDSKIKNLEKELAKKEEELNKTSAELFAAVNLGESDTTSNRSDENSGDNPESEPDSPTQDGPVFPQTAEDAVKEYFGPIDLAQLARYYYPETSKPKTSEGLESPDEEPNAEKEEPSSQISTEPENMGNSVPADAKPKSQEQAPPVLNKEEAEKELPKTEPRPEPVLKEIKKPEKTEKKEKDNQVSERKTTVTTTALSQTKAVVDAKDAPKEKTPKPQTSTKNAGLNPRSKSGNESSFAGELSMKSGNESCEAGELSISVKKAEKNDAASPGRAKTDTPKINKKNASTQNKEEKGSKPTQQEKQPDVKQAETDEQVKGSSAVTTTATVVDKNGKKKSRKDRRKQKKNTQNPEAQSAAKTENNNTVANPGQEKPLSEPDFTESAELDIDLPDDFGIVMEPEEPLPSDLPDINSGSGNIFDDLFNSDSDNWDDSNI